MSSGLSATATGGATTGVSVAALLERDLFAGLPAPASEDASAILGGHGAGATGAGATGAGATGAVAMDGVSVGGITLKEPVGGHTGTVVIAGAPAADV